MAEDDLFIGEVNDEVRRDSAMNFVKKYRFILITVILSVIAFVAVMQWRSAQDLQANEARGDAIELAILGDSGAKDALLALKKQSAMSSLLLGKIEELEGNENAAIVLYKNVADNAAYVDSLRELARLRIFALDENADGAILMNPGAAFEVEAKLIAAERLYANADLDGAVEIVANLLQNERAQSIRPILESTLLSWGAEVPDALGAVGAHNLLLEQEPVDEN